MSEAHCFVRGPPKAAAKDLDASVRVPENDRERLERLARYMGRPSIAEDRVDSRADGSLLPVVQASLVQRDCGGRPLGVELVARLQHWSLHPECTWYGYFGVSRRARLVCATRWYRRRRFLRRGSVADPIARLPTLGRALRRELRFSPRAFAERRHGPPAPP